MSYIYSGVLCSEYRQCKGTDWQWRFCLSTCRGCQPPQSVHTTTSSAPSAQPPVLIPPVCQQPEQKHPERRTQPHSRPHPGHRRRSNHPRVRPAARQLGPQQQRPAGDKVRTHIFFTPTQPARHFFFFFICLSNTDNSSGKNHRCEMNHG